MDNLLLILLITFVFIDIVIGIYLYLQFKRGNIKIVKYKKEEGFKPKHTLTYPEYLTYYGAWDRSVKTYINCTHVDTHSPFYNFYMYEYPEGGVLFLRTKKEKKNE